MKHNKKLQKMLAEGAITKEQADGLLKNIEKVTPTKINATHKSLNLKPIMVALGTLGVMSIFLAIKITPSETGNIITEVQNVAETLNKAGGVGGLKGGSDMLSWVVLCMPFLFILVGYAPFIYNRFVKLEEEVAVSHAHTQSCYQKRADLFPELLSIVKQYISLEKDIAVDTAALRSGAENLTEKIEQARNTDKTPLIEESLEQFMAVIENYPALRAGENIQTLQGQMEQVEGEINVARMYCNEAIRDYNKSIQKFPGNFIATLGGFEEKQY